MRCRWVRSMLLAIVLGSLAATAGHAQRPPSPAEAATYDGLHAAAWQGDVAAIQRFAAAGAAVDATDGAGRTPLHVAAFASHDAAVAALIALGADPDRLEGDRYDIVTIAAVADDAALVERALALGASAANVTSRYDGTALIAAAHLGHADVVVALAAAGAPLDHVNNLGWTALLEAVILGDGGPRHIATVRALVRAGARRDLGDRAGATPLDHARRRGYAEIVAILEGSP